jgi:hypothetical protein
MKDQAKLDWRGVGSRMGTFQKICCNLGASSVGMASKNIQEVLPRKNYLTNPRHVDIATHKTFQE